VINDLRPKERERQAENYTEYEQAEPGFDINYKGNYSVVLNKIKELTTENAE
jgi:hypothetical protein